MQTTGVRITVENGNVSVYNSVTNTGYSFGDYPYSRTWAFLYYAQQLRVIVATVK